MLRTALQGSLTSTEALTIPVTIGEAIEEQKAHQEKVEEREEEQRQFAKAQQEKESAAREELNKAVFVTLVEKGFTPKDLRRGRYISQLNFKLGVKNTSKKSVAGVSGVAVFMDKCDKVVMKTNIDIEYDMDPEQIISVDMNMDYNQFKDDHKALRSMDPRKTRFVFVPKVIVFGDGSRLPVI